MLFLHGSRESERPLYHLISIAILDGDQVSTRTANLLTWLKIPFGDAILVAVQYLTLAFLEITQDASFAASASDRDHVRLQRR